MKHLPKAIWCNKNKILEISCEHCEKELDDLPRVALKCLHRLCSSCVIDQKGCPQCGTITKFEVDLNLKSLISELKQARNNPNMRRNIVHVLQNDGADLGNNNKRRFPRFSRHSKCAYNSPKSNLVYINEPSTSSAYIDYVANLNGGNTKNPAANECRTDKLDDNHLVNFITPHTADELNDVYETRWSKVNSHYISNRLPLCRNFLHKMEAIVLWPDGVNYKLKDFPQCLLRPRYLYVPPIATVCHLIEYLYRRAELEDNWKYRLKFDVEFMPIEDERDEINLWVNPKRNIDYLDLKDDTKSEEYVLVLCKRREDSYFNTNLIMRHPFRALSKQQTIGELLQDVNFHNMYNGNNSNLNGTTNNIHYDNEEQWQVNGGGQYKNSCSGRNKQRPPKFVFRFVPLTL